MSNIVLPPYGRMSLEVILTASVLYGVNITLFGTCVYSLLPGRSRTNRALLVVAVLLFACSTAHVIIQWIMVVHAFTGTAAAALPGSQGADIYFATVNSRLQITSSEIYIFNVFLQDLLLLWRLYAVTAHNWKILILPVIVETAHITCSFVSIGFLANPATDLFSFSVQAWGNAAGGLDIAYNSGVTAAIVFHLWKAGRRVDQYTLRRKNKYLSSIFIVIESGGIFASATLVIYALNLSGSPAGFVGVSAIIQLATLTPLLIIVRAPFGLMHGKTDMPSTFASTQNPLESHSTQVRSTTDTYTLSNRDGTHSPDPVKVWDSV